MKIVLGYQDTRTNKEDFALTPYLFLVKLFGKEIKVLGIGLCWFHSSAYIAIAFGLPKKYPTFYNHNKTKEGV